MTSGGQRHALEQPFFVLATQNPIEQEGTYPLPEAQLDRFMFLITVDYPTKDEERAILRLTTEGEMPAPKAVLGRNEISEIQKLVRSVPIADHVLEFAVDVRGARAPASPRRPISSRARSRGAPARALPNSWCWGRRPMRSSMGARPRHRRRESRRPPGAPPPRRYQLCRVRRRHHFRPSHRSSLRLHTAPQERRPRRCKTPEGSWIRGY